MFLSFAADSGSFFHSAGAVAAVILAAAIAAMITFVFWLRERRKNPVTPEDWGFAFDPQQDIFYATTDAWQKKFGYCRLYDEAAAPMSMILDCEPVRFDCDGKSWLIEFWKGQYGAMTGAEVGVYYTDRPAVDAPGLFGGMLYEAVAPEDMLEIEMVLFKNARALFSRQERHWWLTGFVAGAFSQPRELVLSVRLRLRDNEMFRAFLDGLDELGYTQDDYRADEANDSVAFSLTAPRSRQPETRGGPLEGSVQNNNRQLCEAYQNIAGDFADSREKLGYVKREYPQMHSMIMRQCHPAELYAGFETLRRATGEVAE